MGSDYIISCENNVTFGNGPFLILWGFLDFCNTSDNHKKVLEDK